MIPQFPEFKKLEFSDKADVEALTLKFAPYSDFNFMSMWSWDTKGSMQLSMLNENLVVKFSDYVTGEAFYSFLGTNRVNETARILLEKAKQNGIEVCLKLIPEVVARELETINFQIIEDKDNDDYILSTDVLRNYHTPKTRSRAKSVRKFKRNFVPRTELLDLNKTEIKNGIQSVFELWAKHHRYEKSVVQKELVAINRFIEHPDKKRILTIGIFIGEELVGFCFTELLPGGYAMAHFWRVNLIVSTDLYAYLMQENGRVLSEHGCDFMNIEQDLGLPNLRKWKTSYGSDIFLKKFQIRPKEDTIHS